MQFKKGFKQTLLLAIFIGLIDVLLGLVFSYILNSAPGGTIALMSVLTMMISLFIHPPVK